MILKGSNIDNDDKPLSNIYHKEMSDEQVKGDYELAIKLQKEYDEKVTNSWKRWLERNPDVPFSYPTIIKEPEKSDVEKQIDADRRMAMILELEWKDPNEDERLKSWKNWHNKHQIVQ